MFACARGSDPLGSLFNNLLDHVELDDFPYVDLVVGPLEHCVLTVIFEAKEIEQL